MCCRPSAEIGDKALVLGLRDCTVVGGGTSLLKTQSTPVREFSGMCSGFPIHDPRSVLPSTGGVRGWLQVRAESCSFCVATCTMAAAQCARVYIG